MDEEKKLRIKLKNKVSLMRSYYSDVEYNLEFVKKSMKELESDGGITNEYFIRTTLGANSKIKGLLDLISSQINNLI